MRFFWSYACLLFTVLG